MKHPFAWLHAAVVALGIVISAVLITAKGGHPPAIVLLPVVLIIWLVCHIMLGIIQKLNTIGRRRASAGGALPASWPLSMVFAVVVLSFVVLRLLLVLTAMLISGVAHPPFFAYLLSLLTLAIACLVGILIRKPYARVMTASVSLIASLIIVTRILTVVIFGHGFDPFELLYAVALVAGTAAFGFYVLRSERVRSFFSSDAPA